MKSISTVEDAPIEKSHSTEHTNKQPNKSIKKRHKSVDGKKESVFVKSKENVKLHRTTRSGTVYFTKVVRSFLPDKSQDEVLINKSEIVIPEHKSIVQVKTYKEEYVNNIQSMNIQMMDKAIDGENEVEHLALMENTMLIEKSVEELEFDDILNGQSTDTLSEFDDLYDITDEQPSSASQTSAITDVLPNEKKDKHSLHTSSSAFMMCLRHQHTLASLEVEDKTERSKGQICINDITVFKTMLGEGQMGIVFLANYKGFPVACKRRRHHRSRYLYEIQIQRELYFAAKLSVCRYMNRYMGYIYCRIDDIEKDRLGDKLITKKTCKDIYVVQRYVPNGDGRHYLNKRGYSLHPAEAIQASICLFSALTDAHNMDIGIVDLKLENFLIDSSGSGWLTDFGSCVEFKGKETIHLEVEEVCWTENIAPPEMLKNKIFSKASDVFMATIIIAEMVTSTLTDDEFSEKVLFRHKSGNLDFQSKHINSIYQPFFPLLSAGLRNDMKSRPTSQQMLNYLLEMKR